MYLYKVVCIVVSCVVCFLSLSPDTVPYAHEAAADWIRELRNGDQTKCCGEDDCTPVDSIEVLETRETTMLILINGSITGEIRRNNRVSVPCIRRPHICLQKSVEHNGKIIDCGWINADGSLGIAPIPRCYQIEIKLRAERSFMILAKSSKDMR